MDNPNQRKNRISLIFTINHIDLLLKFHKRIFIKLKIHFSIRYLLLFFLLLYEYNFILKFQNNFYFLDSISKIFENFNLFFKSMPYL